MQVIEIFIIIFLAFLQECPALKKKGGGLNSNMQNGFKLHALQLKLIWPIKFKYSTKPLSDKC